MMIKTVIFLVLVIHSQGKLISSPDEDITSVIVEMHNVTDSKKSGENRLNGVSFETNVIDNISNDLITTDKPKSSIYVELPVYNITSTEKVTDIGINNPINVSIPLNKTEENATSVNTSKQCIQTNEISDENTIITSNEIPCDTTTRIDNGTALILTPYIESGRLKEARKASKVNPEVFLGYESYSGFLTVNKTYNSNTFFWYFPVQDKKVNETPWIIWLQGGPGVSSLIGLFDEFGPFKFDTSGTLKHNPFTWLKNHSLVFIDNPVGAGYSFTDHPDGLAKNMATYGTHLYEAVRQFVLIFPELKNVPLFVAGESYAGKYVPALAMEIHKHKNSSESDINLEGMMMGNAFIDPSEIANLSYPFLSFGLLSREQIEIVNPLLSSFQQDIANNNSIAAKSRWGDLVYVLMILTHQKQIYNFLKDELPFGRFSKHLTSTEIKKALHVGDIEYSFVNITVNTAMANDFLTSSKHLVEELLDNNYRVLVYCGQLDQMLPCLLTSDHYRTWQWKGSAEFLEATRNPYLFNTKLAGYHKSGGGLTEVVMRGAGHMVPLDEPEPIQDLIARWTRGLPLSKHFGLHEMSMQEFIRNRSNIFL